MAHIKLSISSLGDANDKCQACTDQIPRGARMSAAVTEADEPLGWICDKCRDEWKAGNIPKQLFAGAE